MTMVRSFIKMYYTYVRLLQRTIAYEGKFFGSLNFIDQLDG